VTAPADTAAASSTASAAAVAALPTAAARAPAAPAGHGGIVLILVTLLLFVSMDTLVKYLVQRNPAPVLIWLRFLVHMLVAAAIMLAVPRFRPFIRSKAPVRQLVRSALLLCTTTTFFFGLMYLKLADLVILTQAAPLMVVALSVVLLREKVGPRRWLGVLIGFAGVVIILKPGFGFEWASLFGLASAVIYAVYQIMTRSLSGADHTMTTFFYTASVGAVVMAVVAPFFWQTPSWTDALLFLLPGIFGGTGHLLLIMAFARSEASLLAPYFYTVIVWATLLGWAIFGEVPDLFTFIGAGLIVAAGFYVWHRERKIAKMRGQVRA
jgi:drug/metabolite transporter (DMT)-like permease